MDEVLHDLGIGAPAKVVYAELAFLAVRGNRVKVGQRKIAEDTGLGLHAVNQGVRELIEAGHIRRDSGGNSRGRYVLLNPAFRGARKLESRDGEAEEYWSEGVRHKRLTKVRKAS